MKKNELAIYEEFRIVPSPEEKEGIESLKKDFKESKLKTTVGLIGLSILTPLAGEGKKFYSETSRNIAGVFKSSIRDAAINQVSHNIRKMNKKAYQYKKKVLRRKILKEENRIKKKGRLSLIKKLVLLYLGVGFLPFA